EAVAMPWAYADPIEPLYDELVSEVREVDRSAAALRSVVEWADARPKLFIDPNTRAAYREQPDRDGWAGIRPVQPVIAAKVGATSNGGTSKAKQQPAKSEKQPEYALGFLLDRLKKILREGDHDP